MYRIVTASSNKAQKFISVDFVQKIVRMLNDALPYTAEVKTSPQYTNIELFNLRYGRAKIKNLIQSYLQSEGYIIYNPVRSKSFEFVVINQDELFMTITIDEYPDGDRKEVQIYFTFNNTNILFEDWYNRYAKSVR